MACERYWWHGSKEDQQRIVESAGTAVAGNGAVDQGRSPGDDRAALNGILFVLQTAFRGRACPRSWASAVV